MGDEANGSQGGGKALGLPLVLFGLDSKGRARGRGPANRRQRRQNRKR